MMKSTSNNAWQHFTFHEVAEKFPLMDDEELAVLVDDMKANGFDPHFPIRITGTQIVAGRDRWRAAIKAGVQPTFDNLAEDEDPVQVAHRENIQRKHFTPEFLKQNRAERIERVAKARQEGKSTREIAEQEKVSQPQILADLAKATDKGLSVEPPEGKITGKDGRTRTATPQKPGALCERCQRVGATPNCETCREARKPKRKTLSEQVDEQMLQEEDVEELSIEEQIKQKNSVLEGWCRELMKFAETMPDDPWLRDLNRRDGAIQKLKNCCETIRSAKCYRACPLCTGAGCSKCHKTGRVTKYAYDQMV